MFDWNRNLLGLASLAIVVVLLFIAIKGGLGRPLEKSKLVGKTQLEVQNKYGPPFSVSNNRNGNPVWTYYQRALFARARTEVEFRNGIVIEVVGYSPAK